MKTTKLTHATKGAGLAILLLASLQFGWSTFFPPKEALAANQKEKAPESQGATFHITAADGPKILRDLVLEQAAFLVPGTGTIQRLHFFNSSSHGTIGLPITEDFTPDFTFTIAAGQDKNLPISKEQDLNLNEIPILCDSLCNFYVFWEFRR